MDEQEQQAGALTDEQWKRIAVKWSFGGDPRAEIDTILAQRIPATAPAKESTYSAQETWPFGQPMPAPQSTDVLRCPDCGRDNRECMGADGGCCEDGLIAQSTEDVVERFRHGVGGGTG